MNGKESQLEANDPLAELIQVQFPINLRELLQEIESRLMKQAIAQSRYSTEAAKLLGLQRTTFLMKCKRYGIKISLASKQISDPTL